MTPPRLPPWPTTPVACGPVVLREFSDLDVPMVRELSADPYVPLIGSLPSHASEQQARDWVARQRGRLAEGAGFSFAIAEAGTGHAVGGIGLWRASLAQGRATAGYSVAPSARGRGLAGRRISAIQRYAGEPHGASGLVTHVLSFRFAAGRSVAWAAAGTASGEKDVMRVSRSRVRIDAPAQAVWAVLTEPRYVRQWQYGSVLETDWSVGSPIRFTAEWDGATFEQWGTVLRVDAPRELRYSLFAPRPGLDDKPENYFTMTYSLDPDAGSTEVTITQEDPRPAAAGTASEETDDGGENPVLQALKSLAESLTR